jgi:uncharacterized protein (DUF169 family)
VESLEKLLSLRARPVAVAFRAEPPAGLPRVSAAGPSSCSYWKRAAAGESFYTVPEDHWNCPIGAFTHGVLLPEAKVKELEGFVEMAIGLSYLRASEVPDIPRRDSPLGVALYGPFPEAPFEPDVVLVRADARQAMLLSEAAHAAGADVEGRLMLRPTCSLLPAAMQTGHAMASIGCTGNRIYTGLDDGEMYVAIPAPRLGPILAALPKIVAANRELARFHRERAHALETR